jgi:hypothetical protein
MSREERIVKSIMRSVAAVGSESGDSEEASGRRSFVARASAICFGVLSGAAFMKWTPLVQAYTCDDPTAEGPPCSASGSEVNAFCEDWCEECHPEYIPCEAKCTSFYVCVCAPGGSVEECQEEIWS